MTRRPPVQPPLPDRRCIACQAGAHRSCRKRDCGCDCRQEQQR